MKLINYVALAQTFLLVVDYCSALTFLSQFQGKWWESKSSRQNFEEFMTELGFELDKTYAYINGKAPTLNMLYHPTYADYVIYCTDHLGRSFQLIFPKIPEKIRRTDFFGYPAFYTFTYKNNELYMELFKDCNGTKLFFKLQIAHFQNKGLSFLITPGNLRIRAVTRFNKC